MDNPTKRRQTAVFSRNQVQKEFSEIMCNCQFVYFFGYPIITHEPLTDLPNILTGELGKTTIMFLVWFKNSTRCPTKHGSW